MQDAQQHASRKRRALVDLLNDYFCTMPKQRPYAVLFDLDGTLIDSIGLLLACMKHSFEGRTHAPTEEEWIAGIGTPLAKQLEPYATSPEDVQLLVSRYRSFQHEAHDRMTTTFEGVTETLETLRANGHPMALVTSKGNSMMLKSMRFTNIERFMTSMIGADSCEIHKPDPFPVHLALRELGYEPNEAVFVGDSPHDIAAGNAAGVTSIAALWGPFKREDLKSSRPAYFLDDIRGLVPLMERIQSGTAV
jgi:pyrophosphatase PpaX